MPSPFAERGQALEPFLAMEVMERAFELEAGGADLIHLEIGEPDLPPPQAVLAATKRALAEGETHYTDSRGLQELREAIAADKANRTGTAVDPARVLITSGTSPAMLCVFGLVVEAGSEVIVPTPHYPCYPNFVRFFGGQPVFVPLRTDWSVDVDAVAAAVGPRTRGIVVASPANPTGAVQSAETLEGLAALGVPLLSDEIYDGLLFDGARAASALETSGADDAFVFDGFSKRYAMTGFRLGYAIAPVAAQRRLQIMQQNFFISANRFVQRAGVAALEHGEATRAEMVAAYTRRRGLLVDGLCGLGFRVPQAPRGAFYVFADARAFTDDSKAFAFDLLERAGVAVTPGIDFGGAGEGFVRFSLSAPDASIISNAPRAASRRPS